MRVCIVATDTGAGKTYFACALVRALRERGLDVAVCKPVESGTVVDGIDSGPADAIALRAASGLRDPIDLVCPWQLPRPVAPAAELERLGIHLAIDDILHAVERVEYGADVVVVETAGGLRSPLLADASPLTLAQRLGGITLLVAPDRLGTISHTLLALEALQAAAMPAFAAVLSRRTSENPEFLDNRRWIARLGGGGPIYLQETDTPVDEELVDRIVNLLRVRTAE